MSVTLTAVLPNKFQVAAFASTIETGIREIADGVEADFLKTVATWNSRPAFTKSINPSSISISTSMVTVNVGTNDVIYGYVSKGTGSHGIFAKPGKALMFAPGGVPKTKPGMIGSGAGAPGSVLHIQREVIHPGIAARDFDTTIAVKWQPMLDKIMSSTISRAAVASGHSIAGAFKGVFGR